ncbi:MAG: LytTR family transcriptional regulator [Gammaproteobacteria bacterium]|nr:LytTR family transcriptional regulator [Gammaproteobacteria bacterium]
MIIPWLRQPVVRITTWAMRMRFYVIAIILVAISVPFLHLYMDVPLSLAELVIHTLSITLSTAVAILLLELLLWIYLKRKTKKKKWSLSFGLFWLLFLGVALLSFIVMNVTHDLLPITLDIWDRHIKHDLGAAPWKILPVVLLIGYILIQFILRYKTAQELADVKKLNQQLQAAKKEGEPPDNEVKEDRHVDAPQFALPYKGETLYLNPAWIVRVESNQNYCSIWVASNEEQSGSSYMIRITLSEVLNQLPDNLFLQVHRSHIVNIAYVSGLVRQDRNYQLQLTNGDSIPVSRSRIKQIRQKILCL